jgi:hypothetical protein
MALESSSSSSSSSSSNDNDKHCKTFPVLKHRANNSLDIGSTRIFNLGTRRMSR